MKQEEGEIDERRILKMRNLESAKSRDDREECFN